VSEPEPLTNKVEITGSQHAVELRVDGHVLPATAAVLSLQAAAIPVLSVALPVIGGVVVTLDAQTQFEETTRAALIAAGWTPPPGSPLRSTPPSLATLAQIQRDTADDLAAAVKQARADGQSWSQIGRELGMVRETVFRQAKAGSPIVVVKPYQSPKAAQDADALPMRDGAPHCTPNPDGTCGCQPAPAGI
jgi:hypothetical protein